MKLSTPVLESGSKRENLGFVVSHSHSTIRIGSFPAERVILFRRPRIIIKGLVF